MATVNKQATFGNSLREQMEKEVNSSESSSNKVKAKYYINVGIKLQLKSGEIVFIKLPMGIGVDTIKKHVIPNKDSEYARRLLRENELLEDAMAIFNDMQPGDHIYREDVSVEFYRVEELEPEDIHDELTGKISFGR